MAKKLKNSEKYSDLVAALREWAGDDAEFRIYDDRERPREGIDTGAFIEVIDGKVVFEVGTRLPASFIPHEIGHFVASPFGDLLKPNLGLGTGSGEECRDLVPGHHLSILEEEAIINDHILCTHLGFGRSHVTDRMIRVAIGMFKAREEVMRQGVEANDYEGFKIGWDERIAYIKKHSAPEEPEDLEASLGRLLGL